MRAIVTAGLLWEGGRREEGDSLIAMTSNSRVYSAALVMRFMGHQPTWFSCTRTFLVRLPALKIVLRQADLARSAITFESQ